MRPIASIRSHRRQVFWQIQLPLGLAGLLLLAMSVWIVVGWTQATFDTELGMSISVIFLVLPVMFGSLFFLGILAGLVYLQMKILRILPTYTLLAQMYIRYFADLVRYYAGKTILPFLKVQGSLAGGKRLFGYVFKR